MRCAHLLLLLPLAWPLLNAADQTPVPLGAGSYADAPPLKDGKLAEKYNKTPFIHPSQAGRPVPTNDWWTDLVMSGPGGNLWALPTIVKFDATGVMVSYPTGWDEKRAPKGAGVTTSSPLEVRVAGSPLAAPGKKPKNAGPASGAPAPGDLATSVLDWGDWTVVARQEAAADKRWDVTFGHGLPFIWVECSGLQPSLRGGKVLTATTLDGKALTAGAAVDGLLLTIDGNAYGVFGPVGMKATPVEGAVDLAFPAGKPGWLAVGVLPDPKLAPTLKASAGTIPRGSTYSWNYDAAQGSVTTTFALTTAALRPDAGPALQGWLPHHFHTAANDLKPLGSAFATPRGPLLLTQGSTFHLTWTFPGILPYYPVPQVVPGEGHPYDPARMSTYLQGLADIRSQKEPAGDTYWGGKDILKSVQYAAMAARTKDPSAAKLHDQARSYLVDWFTYSGSGDKHYFARYPKWGGLIGFPSSFGSDFFTDNHFHYGYYTAAAGILGTIDPEFLAGYGQVARQVAKQYANWDHDDKAFPFLRTFDPWNGHSYAGGSSSAGGNNQESTSESMNSWSGLVLLGSALGDADMLACGAMGYSVENEAVRCYWNNYYAWQDPKAVSSWPASYARAIVGIMGDSGHTFGTFFSGAPQHVFGIQWLPLSPGLGYLGRDPAFTRYQYDALIKNLAEDKKPGSLTTIGDSWGNVLLGFLQFAEPATVTAELDRLWDANDKIARSLDVGGICYFMAHAGVQLGTVAWDWHASIPTSTVFRAAKGVNAVLWNPEAKAKQVEVRHGATVVKTVTVEPHTLLTVPVTER